ncbi:MAG: magnesium transporter [Opitutales bacterium]
MTEAPANSAEAAEQQPYAIEELVTYHGRDLWSLDAHRLSETSPVVLARFLERRPLEERRDVLRKLSTENASAVLAEMEPEAASEVVGAMKEARALSILEELDLDDAADLLEELEDADRDRLLTQLESSTADTVRELISYDSESAGGIMNPRVATVRASFTADKAIQHIRRLRDEFEIIYYVYVVDREHHLQGIISMRDLILARPDDTVSSFMHAEVRGQIAPEDDREDVARKMAELNLHALPVVDAEGKLLGIITHDDVLDIIQQEATEDIQLLVGAGADEGIHDPISYSVRKRGPWLFVNLLTAIAASFVVLGFEAQIAQLTILAVVMPVVASMGGNTGAQTLAVAIRALALDQVNPREGPHILYLETMKGTLNGLLMGLAYGAGLVAFTGDWILGAVVLAAMIGTMLLAGLSGALIPLLLKRLNMDPAQSSSIFLTTVTDFAGFGLFLGLGAAFLL